MKIINNLVLAYFCNNIENSENYKIKRFIMETKN